jgi:hypothetical protein
MACPAPWPAGPPGTWGRRRLLLLLVHAGRRPSLPAPVGAFSAARRRTRDGKRVSECVRAPSLGSHIGYDAIPLFAPIRIQGYFHIQRRSQLAQECERAEFLGLSARRRLSEKKAPLLPTKFLSVSNFHACFSSLEALTDGRRPPPYSIPPSPPLPL